MTQSGHDAPSHSTCTEDQRSGEIWVTGKASQMAVAKLADLGWTVVANEAQRD